ncbi:MAG: PEP-CTERM sorting domain-containing protein [Methylobacter sp.]|nr:PEP-CTERM sorting domain-containing protein [Methylobacter sp.]
MFSKNTIVRTILLGLSITTFHSAEAALINGGFEDPAVSGGAGWSTPDASLVSGWNTTASDNKIEIWNDGILGVTSYSGTQHAELNANVVSTLFQDASGIAANSTVGYEFAHRGRLGTDTLRLTITDLGTDNIFGGGDDNILFTNTFSTGNTAWNLYSGTGITALGNSIRFAFESVSSAGNISTYGNFLDAVNFGVGVPASVPASVPVPSTVWLLGSGLLTLIGIRKKHQLNLA